MIQLPHALLGLSLAGSIALGAAALPVSPPKAAAAVPASADPKAIETAFDQAFSPTGKFRYTGAVVAVVQDGKLVLAKGYGHEDSAGKIPVDPTATRFRLGSITKTLVGTGIGQLIDKGTISSLDVPLNRYLKRVQLPDNRGQAVTLQMLGTHQAGLAEARMPFQRAGVPKPLIDGAYLRANFPGYVVPVNSGSNYSNFGAAMLGYVIEDQTQQSFAQFAARDVFAPTGMTHSIVVEDARPQSRLADGDALYANGGKRQIPNLWANHPIVEAAGGMASTGEDMARYMIALMGGRDGVPALLSPRARSIVMNRQGGTQPLTQGYGVLFMINDWNGNRIVEHGGRTLGASSYMTLLPDRRTGIFVAVTGDYGQALPGAGLLSLPDAPPPDKAQQGKTLPGLSQIRAIGLEALLGRYRLPIRSQPGAFNAADYVGQYVGQRRSLRSVTQIFSDTFLGGPLTISASKPGEVLLGRTPYVQVGKDIFWHDPALTPDRPSGWSDIMVFRRDANGEVKDMSLLYTDTVFGKATGILTPARASSALLWGALILLTGLLSGIWAKGSRGRIIAPVAAIAIILSPIIFFRSWPKASVESLSYLWITPGDLALFQLWLDATVVLAIALVAFAALGLRRPADATGWRAAWGRWHLRLLSIGAVLLTIGYGYYGMIGWNVT
jgi:CubicO group peptidase (beta-lactamase class C family)